jgi:hypothetical protein
VECLPAQCRRLELLADRQCHRIIANKPGLQTGLRSFFLITLIDFRIDQRNFLKSEEWLLEHAR